MYAAVSSLKGIIKLGQTSIDNVVFKLHTKLSVLILAVFSVVVSTNQFFGDPIDCMTSHKDEFPGKVLDNFCWIHSTFVLPSAFHKPVGSHVPSPGIDKHTAETPKTYISYYQWVCFFLFFAAVLFYLPKFIWKSIEGKKVEQLMLGLNCPIQEKQADKESKINKLASYLKQSLNHNNYYAYGFSVCELLNFINVVGQIYFTDAFLGGEFTTYGTEVIGFMRLEQMNRTDPMIQIFPRVTKCTFHKFGPTGSIQNHDALCVLPINIINEKIFIFLWFWYIILSVISGIAIIYRILLISFPRFRLFVIHYKCRYVSHNDLSNVLAKFDYGDWFVLNMLAKNINAMNYVDLIEELDNQMTKNDFNYERASTKSA